MPENPGSFFERRKFGRSNILPLEQVRFFPTFGRYDTARNAWELCIHGWIHAPLDAVRPPWRRLGFRLLCRLFGITAAMAEEPRFRERMTPFLVPSPRGKQLSIRLGDAVFPLSASEATGHFRGSILLPRDRLDSVLPRDAAGARTGCRIPFRAVVPPGDQREFPGAVQLISGNGISVISDIDDTIKDTHVLDRRAMIRNTFLNDFKPVSGMAERYRDWAAAGVVFHYVSASPWQLFEPLEAFAAAAGFPWGTFHLKPLRFRNTGLLRLLSSSKALKRKLIGQIFKAFPDRRFVLIGDTGQRDPETYGWLARKRPRQVVGIYIRNLKGESPTDGRYVKAFRKLDPKMIRFFVDASELPASL